MGENNPSRLALLGASVRAAAFSALPAGETADWQIVAADLFADTDLAARCPATRITDWPAGFAPWLESQSVDAWLYTGGLENYPDLVDRLATLHLLWGNRGEALRCARDPGLLQQILARADSPFPAFHLSPSDLASNQKWLVKSTTSAGGLGVADWVAGSINNWPNNWPNGWQSETPFDKDAPFESDPFENKAPLYYQQRIEGRAISAAYLTAEGDSVLLGVTEQLIGRAWTRASAYQYAGSVGPLSLPPSTEEKIRLVGNLLAKELGLVGLLGVDFVVDRHEVPWLVDVNPRYTASMEIVEQMQAITKQMSTEQAVGYRMLRLHQAACTGGQLPKPPPRPQGSYYGKAYLFAHREVTVGEISSHNRADLPAAGTTFAPHSPIATVFAKASTWEQVEPLLQQRAEQLEREIYQ